MRLMPAVELFALRVFLFAAPLPRDAALALRFAMCVLQKCRSRLTRE